MDDMPMPGCVPMSTLPPLFSPLHLIASPQLKGAGFDRQADDKISSAELEAVVR